MTLHLVEAADGFDDEQDQQDQQDLVDYGDPEAQSGPGPLFPSDIGQLSRPVRETLVTLIKRRYISADRHPADWAVLTDNEPALQARLNDLFLELVIDRDYQIAYKRQAVSETGNKFPTLLYDKEYNREETIILVHLRHLIRLGQSEGSDHVFVDRDALATEVEDYRPPSATNRVKCNNATRTAIESLIKSEILLRTDTDDRYRISPIVEVLLPVTRIQELADWLREQNDPASPGRRPGRQEALDLGGSASGTDKEDPDEDPDEDPNEDDSDEDQP